MNIREGMRRVGIVLGALGCVAGGAFGYWNFQNAWSLHTKFERLQALPVMRDVNTAIKRHQDLLAEPNPFSSIGGVPVPCTEFRTFLLTPTTPTAADFENFIKWDTEESGVARQAPKSIMHGTVGDYLINPDKDLDYETGFDVCNVTAANGSILGFKVDVNDIEDIQTVNADKAGAISSIQLTKGEWTHRGPKTLRSRLAFIASLLLPLCYPVIGFLVPWGTIKLFVWVGIGFSEQV
jgi:hypothetical protein